MNLADKYRPRMWADVIGQDKAVSKLLALRDRSGLAGRAYFLTGQSGTGKTSIGYLIAGEVADEFFVEELDAATLTVSDLQRLENEMQTCGWGEKSGRAYLINEAHALRKPVIRQLLVLLERIPRHVAIIFTTTTQGQDALFEDCDDASPLLSRCLQIKVTPRDVKSKFAAALVKGAREQGLLNGHPDSFYLKRAELLVKKCSNNLRAAWQAVEIGYLTDTDDEE